MSKETPDRIKGYKLREELPRQHYKTLMTDDQVLECRARHEFDGWSRQRLASAYGVSVEYMRRLLDYTVRSKLVPKRPAV
jgi:AraC-like DNA-binding protein